MASNVITVRHEIVLADDTKDFLTALVRPFVQGVHRLETKLSDISDFLDAQGSKADNLAAALADVSADVQALLAKAGSAGVFSADEQAKADALSGKFDAITTALSALDTAVGDQDGSDNPTP